MARWNWPHLPDVSSSFSDKVAEINDHFDLMHILLHSNCRILYDKNSCFKPQKEHTHPLKAGTALLIYNFVESVAAAMMRDIHNHIQQTIKDLNLYECRLKYFRGRLRQKIIAYQYE